jgi:hypothetical protein
MILTVSEGRRPGTLSQNEDRIEIVGLTRDGVHLFGRLAMSYICNLVHYI